MGTWTQFVRRQWLHREACWQRASEVCTRVVTISLSFVDEPPPSHGAREILLEEPQTPPGLPEADAQHAYDALFSANQLTTWREAEHFAGACNHKSQRWRKTH